MSNPAELRWLCHDVAEPLGLELQTTQAEQLLSYLDHLQRWNQAYNLTAVRDRQEMRVQHLADCLAVVPPLRRWAGQRDCRVLDVGSGGGLPGVVLAVLQPRWRVTCVDSVGKKAAFVRQVAAALGLTGLEALHQRVETLPAAGGAGPDTASARGVDLVVCRAFATLAEIVRLSAPVLAPGGVWLAMKGKLPEAEIAEVQPKVDVFHVEPVTVPGLQAQRCLVWMRPRQLATTP